MREREFGNCKRKPWRSRFRIVSRAVAVILLPAQLQVSFPVTVKADTQSSNPSANQPTGVSQRGFYNPPLVRTATNLVKQTPLKLEVSPYNTLFSDRPSDQEIDQSRVMPAIMCPVGNKSTPAENKDLAQSLQAYQHRSSEDDVTALTAF